MASQVFGVQPWLLPVRGIGEGEKPGEVGVAFTGPGQQHQPGPVRKGQLPAGDGPDVQAAGQPGKLQRSAQVGVGEGQGVVTVLLGPGQQLVGMGRAQSEGVETLEVKLGVCGGHGLFGARTPAYTSSHPYRLGTG